MIRLHDRLVLRLVLQVLLFAALGWVILWVLIDLFEKIDNFVDHQATNGAIVRYYLYLARRLGFLDLRRYRALVTQHDAAVREIDAILTPAGPRSREVRWKDTG